MVRRILRPQPEAPGVDRFEVLVDFGPRPMILMPEPALTYTPLGDIDGDGDIDSMDQDAFVALLLGTPLLPEHTGLADLNGDGEVGPFDLAFVLGFWGPNPGHPADLVGDGEVGPLDLALVLGNWGPCP